MEHASYGISERNLFRVHSDPGLHRTRLVSFLVGRLECGYIPNVKFVDLP